MTSTALDWRSLRAKLRKIDDLLSDLQALGDIDLDRLRDDRTAGLAAERVLTLIVDLAVSINSHVCAVELGRTADSYSASFLLAAEVGILDKDLAERLRPSAGLRNVLVHNYVDIDHSIVVRAIPMAIEQYRLYIDQVAGWLVERTRSQETT